MRIEVILTPAEIGPLAQRDLRETVCVVFDVLRATSTMITALANGAAAIVPVAEISEALARRERQPDVLLAGERDGVRIEAELAGGRAFDLGNSPREFTRNRVEGRTIVTTTTNGTRALRACAQAQTVVAAAILNLQATADWLITRRPAELLMVCSGTFEEAAYEDIIAAGALCDLLQKVSHREAWSDSAHVASHAYSVERFDLVKALSVGRNGRRLLTRSELAADVSFCAQLNTANFVALMNPEGLIHRQP